MSECDTVVHQYLLTVSQKLAERFKKKIPALTPWAGPGLVKLIEFYKRNCNENTAPSVQSVTTETKEVITNGKKRKICADIITNITKKGKGKKRKLAEMEEPVATPSTVAPSGEASEKKKKKKKKKSQPKPEEDSSDIVEVIPDSPTIDEEALADEALAEEALAADEALAEEAVAIEPIVEEFDQLEHSNKKSKLKRKSSGSSFRRIKEEDIVIKKKELADNTFEAKRGDDDFGFKAHQILKFTKGKSFRHEKTKKKRGTYKGGAINMGVTSVKFDSDSD